MANLLAEGTTGPEVAALQGMLNGAEPAVSKVREDGIFGKRTEASVIQFQKSHSLKPDGIAGPVTRAVLALHHVPKQSARLKTQAMIGWTEIASRRSDY